MDIDYYVAFRIQVFDSEGSTIEEYFKDFSSESISESLKELVRIVQEISLEFKTLDKGSENFWVEIIIPDTLGESVDRLFRSGSTSTSYGVLLHSSIYYFIQRTLKDLCNISYFEIEKVFSEHKIENFLDFTSDDEYFSESVRIINSLDSIMDGVSREDLKNARDRRACRERIQESVRRNRVKFNRKKKLREERKIRRSNGESWFSILFGKKNPLDDVVIEAVDNPLNYREDGSIRPGDPAYKMMMGCIKSEEAVVVNQGEDGKWRKFDV